QRTSALVHSKVAVSAYWPFLSSAVDERDFENRLEIASTRIASLVDPILLDDVLSSLREDYRLVTGAKNPFADDDDDDPKSEGEKKDKDEQDDADDKAEDETGTDNDDDSDDKDENGQDDDADDDDDSNDDDQDDKDKSGQPSWLKSKNKDESKTGSRNLDQLKKDLTVKQLGEVATGKAHHNVTVAEQGTIQKHWKNEVGTSKSA